MKYIYTLILLCFALMLNAQSKCKFTLKGKVTDSVTKEPLEFAYIYIEELKTGSVSDVDGNFKTDSLCEGVYTLKISHIGCSDLIVSVNMKGNKSLNVKLPHTTYSLHEFQVIGEKAEKKRTQPASKLSERDREETKGQSLGESLKRINGVNTLETGSTISKPVINGLHSNRVLILNNGVRQEGQQWGSEHAPEIDPFTASSFVVVKGANSVRYGSDAIGGLILVEPKPLRDSAGMNAELNLVGNSNGRMGVLAGMLEGNVKKIPAFSWRLQGTLKRSGNNHTPTYYLENTGVKEYNFSGIAGWNKSGYGIELFYSQFNNSNGIYTNSHIGNLSDLQRAIASNAAPENTSFSYDINRPLQHVEHELFKAKAFVKTGLNSKLHFIYARQFNNRFEYDKHRPRNNELAAKNLPDMQLRITTHSADLFLENKLFKTISNTLGVSGMMQGNTYSGRYFIPNYQNYTYGLFLIERYQYKKFEFEGGLRYDYKWLKIYKYENNVIVSPENEFRNISGSLGSLYRANEHLIFNINVGSAWRAPGVNELYSNGLHHGAASVEVGDANLQTERALNTVGGLQFTSDVFKAEVNVYSNRISNFIYLEPALPPTLTIRGAFPTFKYKQLDASLNGADVQTRFRLIKNLSFLTKLSVLRARNTNSGEFLSMMPSDRVLNELAFDFKNSEKIRNAYISINALHVFKQSRVSSVPDYKEAPEAYTLLNINTGFSIQLKKQHIEFGFSVTNVLNTVYRDYMDRFRYFSDRTGRNYSVRLTLPISIY